VDKVEETGEGEGEIVSRKKIHHFGKPTVALARERERVGRKKEKKEKRIEKERGEIASRPVVL